MNSTMNQTIGASASPLAAVCFSTISTLRQSSSWWNPWSILTRIPWGSDVAVCKENPERVLVLLKAHSTNVFSCCWRKVAADCSALSDFKCWIRSLHLRSSCNYQRTCRMATATFETSAPCSMNWSANIRPEFAQLHVQYVIEPNWLLAFWRPTCLWFRKSCDY